MDYLIRKLPAIPMSLNDVSNEPVPPVEPSPSPFENPGPPPVGFVPYQLTSTGEVIPGNVGEAPPAPPSGAVTTITVPNVQAINALVSQAQRSGTMNTVSEQAVSEAAKMAGQQAFNEVQSIWSDVLVSLFGLGPIAKEATAVQREVHPKSVLNTLWNLLPGPALQAAFFPERVAIDLLGSERPPQGFSEAQVEAVVNKNIPLAQAVSGVNDLLSLFGAGGQSVPDTLTQEQRDAMLHPPAPPKRQEPMKNENLGPSLTHPEPDYLLRQPNDYMQPGSGDPYAAGFELVGAANALVKAGIAWELVGPWLTSIAPSALSAFGFSRLLSAIRSDKPLSTSSNSPTPSSSTPVTVVVQPAGGRMSSDGEGGGGSGGEGGGNGGSGEGGGGTNTRYIPSNSGVDWTGLLSSMGRLLVQPKATAEANANMYSGGGAGFMPQHSTRLKRRRHNHHVERSTSAQSPTQNTGAAKSVRARNK